MKTRTFVPKPRKSRELEPITNTVSIYGETWMTYGACAGVSTNIFFPETDELPSEDARILCARCPVREECLQWALAHNEDGYWGGTTKTQREAIMSGRHRVKCPYCAGRDVITLRETICLACGLSW